VAKGLETQGVDGPQPPAADMYELVWDEGLAAAAQRYFFWPSVPFTTYHLKVTFFFVNSAFSQDSTEFLSVLLGGQINVKLYTMHTELW
jgi:hypothetical protein